MTKTLLRELHCKSSIWLSERPFTDIRNCWRHRDVLVYPTKYARPLIRSYQSFPFKLQWELLPEFYQWLHFYLTDTMFRRNPGHLFSRSQYGEMVKALYCICCTYVHQVMEHPTQQIRVRSYHVYEPSNRATTSFLEWRNIFRSREKYMKPNLNKKLNWKLHTKKTLAYLDRTELSA